MRSLDRFAGLSNSETRSGGDFGIIPTTEDEPAPAGAGASVNGSEGARFHKRAAQSVARDEAMMFILGVLFALGALFAAGVFVGALWRWKPMGAIVLCICTAILLLVIFENWKDLDIRAVLRGGWGPISSWLVHWSIGLTVFMSPLVLGAVMGLSFRRRSRSKD